MGVLLLVAWVGCGLAAFFSGADPVKEFDKEEGNYLAKAFSFLFCLVFYIAFGPLMLLFKWFDKKGSS